MFMTTGRMTTAAALLALLAVSPPVRAASEVVVYAFKGGGDGEDPLGRLAKVERTLFGTTFAGGGDDGRGTLFAVTPSGFATVLHSFGPGIGGKYPISGVTGVAKNLIGTADTDVFETNLSGHIKVLHRFRGGQDGFYPAADLINVTGAFYGTTLLGGGSNACFPAKGCGTVFALTEAGDEKVLHAFTGGSDGAFPQSDLAHDGTRFYGTTTYGGNGSCTATEANGCGVIFTVTDRGTEKVIYSFTGGSNGAYPLAGLLKVGKTYFGTTSIGGTTGCYQSEGCGVIFSVTAQGTENTLYAFKGGSDGATPEANLIDVNGTIYGTTTQGGGTGCGGFGCGTVFSITAGGVESKIYAFQGGSDGRNPSGPLLDVNGILYGVTGAGGGNGCAQNAGCGTLFAVTP
jgi:uncharacterized repeat protein (TIGR03803 family)